MLFRVTPIAVYLLSEFSFRACLFLRFFHGVHTEILYRKGLILTPPGAPCKMGNINGTDLLLGANESSF